MQQREGFSTRTLALSTAAAELGRVILRAGQSGSVRAVLLGNVLATAALVLLAVFVFWNAARLRRPGFVGNCCCAAFLLWYLWEFVRTAAMIQQSAGSSSRRWPFSVCCRCSSGLDGASAVSCMTVWPLSSGHSWCWGAYSACWGWQVSWNGSIL